MKYINKEISVHQIDAYKLRGKTFFNDVQKENEALLEQYHHLIRDYNEFVCALCQLDEGKIFLEWEEKYQLIQCDNCNAISANINQDDNSLYENEGHFQRSTEMIAENYEYRKKTFGLERYDYCINRLDLNPSKINVLDVGSGFGYFLSVLEDKGVKNKGLEVDPLSIKYCKDLGLNVSSSGIEEELDATYDLILMFDVIEHLYQPLEFFTEASKKLNNNGYLIAYTPNIHSVSFELMGSQQNLLHPFQHVCFYNNKSLEFLAKKTGLEIISVDYFGLDIIDYLLMKEYDDQYSYFEKLREFSALIQSCLDQLKISNHLRVTFKKK